MTLRGPFPVDLFPQVFRRFWPHDIVGRLSPRSLFFNLPLRAVAAKARLGYVVSEVGRLHCIRRNRTVGNQVALPGPCPHRD